MCPWVLSFKLAPGRQIGGLSNPKEDEMPIVAVFEFPGESLDKYRKVFEVGGRPITHQPSRRSHICYEHDGGFTVVDVWEDEASFAAFGEVIGPATAEAGLDAKPRVHQLSAEISQTGEWTTY